MSIAKNKDFPDLEFLDFGSGFKVPYGPNEIEIDYKLMGQEIIALFSDFCDHYNKKLRLYFEPGKFLTAKAGSLLVEVNTIKTNRKKTICGNICETGDLFAKKRFISRIGGNDLLSINDAGAYCYAMGGVYNLRPMPAEVVVETGRISLSRRRITSDELVHSILKESNEIGINQLRQNTDTFSYHIFAKT